MLMAATMWRPRGPGPFPLAVINHASAEDPEERIEDPIPRYDAVSVWFAQHGYAVMLPLRPGHGETGGSYLEGQGGCDNADYFKSGLATAASIEAALNYAMSQPFVRKDRALVVGQSAGGWGALALASHNPPRVRAVINFAGGRGGQAGANPNTNCAPEHLVTAAAEFGRTARIMSLWIYAQNDSFFGPALSKRLADAFSLGGAPVEYHLLPPFGEDGHFLITSDAVAAWAPIVEKFLARTR